MSATSVPFDGAGATERSVIGGPVASRLGQLSWAMFEWARNPYYILIVIYIYAPYFSSVVVGDPVKGQALAGTLAGYAGLMIAILAPILGAIADSGGRRKPWIVTWMSVLAVGTWMLWYALPNGAGQPLYITGALLVINAVMAEFTQPFHNAMLPSIAPPSRIGSLSGLGLALGNAGALLILVVMLCTLTLPGVVRWPFVPDHVWFGLDPKLHEPSRIAGPIVAVWLLVFALPMLLFTPDRQPHTLSWTTAIANGFRSLGRTLRSLKHYRNIALYLLARIIYTDGKKAVIVFGGIYAVGNFGWDLLSTLLFGIVLTVFAVIGGIVGGWMDDRLGSKQAILISIGFTILGLLGELSITPKMLFFVIPWDPHTATRVWDLPFFATVPEVVYVGVATLVAVFITAAYANSRTMLARIAPPEKMTEFFGMYSMSGLATTSLSSFTVAAFTTWFASQRAGYAAILIFLAIGFVLMLFVREERAALSG